MGILNRAKNFVNDRPMATSFLMGSALWFAGMSIFAGVTTLFVGSGAANVAAKFIVTKVRSLIWGTALPPGTVRFKDKDDGVYFSLNEKAHLFNTRPVTLQSGKEVRLPRAKAITMYALYRNALVDSYRAKADLAQDIKVKPAQFTEDQALAEIMAKGKNAQGVATGYSDDEKGLYRYAMAVVAGIIKDLNNPAEKMKAFLAYENVGGKEQHVGFVHFTEKTLQGNPVVYIAEACVAKKGTGVGRRLMELVLSHYPAGTEFRILTRAFNTEAKVLYGTRLGFEPLDENLIEELGYSKDRYVGYWHVSTEQEIAEIKGKQISNITRPSLVA